MSEIAQQTTINPASFINERKRGRQQGEKDTLARIGVTSVEEAIAAISAYRQSKSQGGSDQAAAKAAENAAAKAEGASASSTGTLDLAAITKLLDEKLSPTAAKIEALLKEQADEKASAMAAAKEAEAEKSARQKEEAEEKAAAAALAKEIKWFKKLAKAEGVDDSDPDNMETVISLYEKRISKMSDEEAEAAFGEDVDEEDRAAFVKAELTKIKKKAPGLFKSDATDTATKTAATTGKPQGKPDAAASPKTEKRVLDARKLSPKQFAAYRRDPAKFVKEFEAGLIDYETPAAGEKK